MTANASVVSSNAMRLWLLVASASLASCALIPSHLSVNYWSPGDVAAANLSWVPAASAPRFSWQLESATARRGLEQISYRVQVENTGTGSSAWDSGTVHSNRTLHVEYGGQTLLAVDERYQWRVQVTDTDGATSKFSEWHKLATALPHKAWDAAEWVYGGVAAPRNDQDTPTQVPPPQANKHGNNQLRTEFTVTEQQISTMSHASLFYAGVGYSVAWLNGNNLAPEEALGPWTTWSQRILYRCKDVSLLLRPGANAIGVWLGGGQYDSTWTHAWWKGPHGSHPPLGLRLILRLTLKNGTAITLATSRSGSWSASSSPFVSDDVYKGVVFDARNISDGFATPSFQEGKEWAHVVPVPNSSALFGQMSPHVYTPSRIVSERKPIRMTQPHPGRYVYWFPENSVGWAQINDVNLPAGTTLSLAHGEQLAHFDSSGKLIEACLVGCDNGTVWYAWGGAVDTYTLRGGEAETYGALFSYHGFQFVELTGWPSDATPPTLATVSAQVVHADNARIAQLQFPTSGKADLLNKLHDNIVRSLLSNMHSVESDCPTRERVGWTGDSQATAETAVMNLDMRGFWAKWLQDYEDAQCPGKPGCPGGSDHGALSSTIPFGKHTPPVDPSWPTSYCQETMLLYKYFGDESVMRDRFDSIQRYVDYLPTPTSCKSCRAPTNTKTHPDGYPEMPWYYMNGDWMEYEVANDELSQSGPLLSSYHYILDVTLLGEMAQILGKHELATKYLGLAEKLWSAFNSVYLAKQPPPAPSAPTTCDESVEIRKGGHPLNLKCESGGVIDKVLAAFMGTPSGSCAHGFARNLSCDAGPSVETAVERLCVGKPSCSLSCAYGKDSPIGVKTDPCQGVIKSLAVSVHCVGGVPAPPPPPPPSPLFGYATPGQLAGQLEQVVMLAPERSARIPTQHKADVAQTLLNEIAKAGNHITTGFIGNKYAWPAMTDIGQGHLALNLALQTTAPSYGYQIANGATTLWENWSGSDLTDTQPERGQGPSHNHHFMGGIGQWLQTDLIGLQQGNGVAYSHPVIAPAIVNHTELAQASGRFQTMRGEISVSWKYDAGRLALNATLPPGVRGTVVMTCAAAVVYEAGQTIWPVDRLEAVRVEGLDDIWLVPSRDRTEELVAVSVRGGSYAFDAECLAV